MKLVRILTISFCIIIILSQNILAIDTIFDTGKKWWNTGKDNAGIGIDTNLLKDGSSQIYNLLLVIATVTAIIVGAILGIQFMTAGIDKKVEVKQSLIPYFVSCIVVFGSLGIWRLVVSIASQIK